MCLSRWVGRVPNPGRTQMRAWDHPERGGSQPETIAGVQIRPCQSGTTGWECEPPFNPFSISSPFSLSSPGAPRNLAGNVSAETLATGGRVHTSQFTPRSLHLEEHPSQLTPQALAPSKSASISSPPPSQAPSLLATTAPSGSGLPDGLRPTWAMTSARWRTEVSHAPMSSNQA